MADMDENYVPDLFEQGEQFMDEVNDVFENQFGGDIESAEWFDYCQRMDEWQAAVQANVNAE